MDYSPPRFSVHGILRARILERVFISFSRGSSWPKEWAHILLCLIIAGGIVVAMHSGNKLTQKDDADSEVQFITPAGPRQSLVLAKDPDQFLWKSFVPYVYSAQTHLPKFLETCINKER